MKGIYHPKAAAAAKEYSPSLLKKNGKLLFCGKRAITRRRMITNTNGLRSI